MFPQIITLTRDEILKAGSTGMRREISARLKASEHNYISGKWTDGWRQNIEGALGEYAAARALGIAFDYDAVDVYNVSDLVYKGNRVQVRTAIVKEWEWKAPDILQKKPLIVKPTDPDDWICLLVTGAAPKYSVCGWMPAGEAKALEDCLVINPENEKDKPAWYIPQHLIRRDPIPAREGSSSEKENTMPREQAKSFEEKVWLIIAEATNEKGGGTVMRVMSWIVDGKQGKPQIDKRDYWMTEDGDRRIGKAKGLTAFDLLTILKNISKIAAAMGMAAADVGLALSEGQGQKPAPVAAGSVAGPDEAF
jgi:hypothetical protein